MASQSRGDPADVKGSWKKRIALVKHVLGILEDGILSTKEASSVVEVLSLDFDSLCPEALVDLSSFFLDSVKSDGTISSGRSFELFPKLLYSLSTLARLPESYQSGKDYSHHAINTLCARNWPPSAVVRLVAMFREIPLSNEQLQFAATRAIRAFHDLGPEEQPALTYQLLLLSSKVWFLPSLLCVTTRAKRVSY